MRTISRRGQNGPIVAVRCATVDEAKRLADLLRVVQARAIVAASGETIRLSTSLVAELERRTSNASAPPQGVKEE